MYVAYKFLAVSMFGNQIPILLYRQVVLASVYKFCMANILPNNVKLLKSMMCYINCIITLGESLAVTIVHRKRFNRRCNFHTQKKLFVRKFPHTVTVKSIQ